MAQGEESGFFGISIRGWITILLVSTVCFMSLKALEVKEPLYTLVSMACGFYLGQKGKRSDV
jgi:hypothetical protein